MKSNHIQDLQPQATKKNKGEITEAVTTSSLIPESAPFSAGWCKEACVRRESSLALTALKYQNISSAILPSEEGEKHSKHRKS